MSVSIILVNYNRYELTRTALRSIREHAAECEAILVDNNSDDGSAQRLAKEFPGIKVIPLKENKGFGAANNIGAEAASRKFLFFLNNDTVLKSNAPRYLSGIVSNDPTVGGIGPKLVYPDGSYQLSFGHHPNPLNEWRVRRMQRSIGAGDLGVRSRYERRFNSRMEVDWLTGAALMVPAEVFEKVGGFDPSYFMYFEDADFCRRIRATGLRLLYEPSISVVHIGGGTVDSLGERISIEYRRSQLRYYSKHCSFISRLFLRSYLFVAFGFRWMKESIVHTPSASAARDVVKLALTSGVS